MNISTNLNLNSQVSTALPTVENLSGNQADSFLDQLAAIEPEAAGQEETVSELQEAFRQFVGNTLYGQMLKSMRSTLDKPAYMHGGKTEEIFQQQLDQIMVEDLTQKSADTIADPMFELFNMRRSG